VLNQLGTHYQDNLAMAHVSIPITGPENIANLKKMAEQFSQESG
jgi:hypothetical protein|tara:strand:- start:878 stop:1009 length:132 start_codon:yes stop_codon:yes gene_type:complete